MVAKKVVSKKSKGKKEKTKPTALFPSRKRNFGIGQDIRPKTDLGRFVKWPRYVRIQRQRKILLQRLKVPPSINQFTHTLDKNQATELFKLLANYQPETKAQKKDRLKKLAGEVVAGKTARTESTKPPPVIKYGLKHVTTLVEEKKAKLVVIASNVDPIELVLWLPALCRKMDVPFCIVKEKARLGTLVHQKKATCLALTAVSAGDQPMLTKLADICRTEFNQNMGVLKKWGGGVMGLRTQARMERRAKAVEEERLKKAQMAL